MKKLAFVDVLIALSRERTVVYLQSKELEIFRPLFLRFCSTFADSLQANLRLTPEKVPSRRMGKPEKQTDLLL